MNRILLIIILVFGMSKICSQVVIDKKNGRYKLRAKTEEDYRMEKKNACPVASGDTLAYKKMLTLAFNELYRDSLEAAKMHFNEALHLAPQAPGNYIIHGWLGKIAYQQQAYFQAVHEFTKVLLKQPEEREIRCLRAAANLELSKSAEAMDDCGFLLPSETDPKKKAKLYLIRGTAHMQLRQYAPACEDFKDEIKLDSVNPGARLLLAVAQQNLERYADAVKTLDDLLKLQETQRKSCLWREDVYVMKAELLTALQRPKEASEAYTEAIRLCPDNRQLYLKRARLYKKMERLEEMRKDARKALSLGVSRKVLKGML